MRAPGTAGRAPAKHLQHSLLSRNCAALASHAPGMLRASRPAPPRILPALGGMWRIAPAPAIAGYPLLITSNALLRARQRQRQRRHFGPDDVAQQVRLALVTHQVRVSRPVIVGQ